MKVIGITRRMDDLGRVVIPKEVRQSLGINEGDFLEIVGTDRGLLMQKCGEAYGNEPVPKGVETEEKDKIFVFRDLGRVVIPKEIRRNMNIREGDPLEIFIEDGGVVFKKYSLLSSFAPQAAHIQKVLSINGISASVFDNSSLLCGPRPFGMSKTPDEWLNIRNWGTEWKGKSLFVTPIIAEGEVIGFICYKNDKESAHDMIRLSAQFLAQFAEN